MNRAWRETGHGPGLWGAWVSDQVTGGDLVVVQRGYREFGAAIRDWRGRVSHTREGFANLQEARTWAETQLEQPGSHNSIRFY